MSYLYKDDPLESLLLIFNLPSMFILGHFLGGEWVLLPMLSLYVISPILDLIIIGYFPRMNKLNFFRGRSSGVINFALRLYPLIQLSIFTFVMLKLKTSAINLDFWLNALGFGVVCGGTGLMIAHELMHRKDQASYMGTLILTGMCGYTHWIIEHIYGHHKNVATLEDPCSARYGETLYAFMARSITAQYLSAFKINGTRFLKLKSLEFLFYLTVWHFFGVKGLLFVLVQSIVGVFLLEHVNYVEHYGLAREKNAEGRYQKITNEHSWDSHSILANVALLNLGFHGDHHAHVDKQFVKLIPKSERIIKFGIPVQLLQSFVPRIWFKIMHPKLDKVRHVHA